MDPCKTLARRRIHVVPKKNESPARVDGTVTVGEPQGLGTRKLNNIRLSPQRLTENLPLVTNGKLWEAHSRGLSSRLKLLLEVGGNITRPLLNITDDLTLC